MMKRNTQKNAIQSFTAVGAPSIMMIFVILCLTCFAALSLVSANAEMRLATRMGTNTAAWYEADANAQKRLAELEGLLADGILKQADPADAFAAGQFSYEENDGSATVTFYTKITEYTTLETQVRLTDGKGGYTILRNETVVTGDLSYTELPFIWDGVTIDD